MDVEGLEHPDKWAVETFGTAELGDVQRTDRLVKMATVIAENPSASLPESTRNWADTLAAYRFLDNPSISHEQIILPHWMQTREEAMEHSRVLLVADGRCHVESVSYPDPDGLAEAQATADGTASPRHSCHSCRFPRSYLRRDRVRSSPWDHAHRQ